MSGTRNIELAIHYSDIIIFFVLGSKSHNANNLKKEIITPFVLNTCVLSISGHFFTVFVEALHTCSRLT